MIPFLLTAALTAASPAGATGGACITAGPAGDAHYIAVDDHTILIEQGRRWFKLTVLPTSRLKDSFASFVNVVRGPSTLCSRLDFDLSVVSPPGTPALPLIVQDFHPIPEIEARALKTRPKR